MYSIDFPDIFRQGRVSLLSDKDAAKSNLKLLLGAEREGLFGDPGFGTKIKKFIFEQNSVVMHDLVREEIYEAILSYLPQIQVERNDITITKENEIVYITIRYRYLNDTVTDMFSIEMLAD